MFVVLGTSSIHDLLLATTHGTPILIYTHYTHPLHTHITTLVQSIHTCTVSLKVTHYLFIIKPTPVCMCVCVCVCICVNYHIVL